MNDELDWIRLLRLNRAKFQGADDEHPGIQEYESSYKRASEAFEGFPESDREYAEKFPNPLLALKHFDDIGVLPPPELVSTIIDLFDSYLLQEGEVDLEAVLLGPKKRGVGNFSAQRALANDLAGFWFERTMGRAEGLSDLEIAEVFISKKNLNIEPESLLRKYRRRYSKDK